MPASEIPPVRWRKSSYSGEEGTACVEVAGLAMAVAVRDSKDPDGPHLTFDRAAWHALTAAIKHAELDL